MPDEFDQEFWEGHHRGHREAHQEASPNHTLVAVAGDLPPGRALDAGCGHGADALWLATRGWQVTAVDISPSALSDARERAASHSGDVASRIEWVQADLASWSPPEVFDLVTSHYVHVPAADRDEFVCRLAASVAPGGTLLVVGHDASGLHEEAHGPAPEAYLNAKEAAALLDPAVWTVDVAETRTHAVAGHDGGEVSLRDAVLRARRHT